MNYLSVPSVPPRVQMLRLDPTDRIRIGEIHYTNSARFDRGYVLRRVDAPDLTEAFTHQELWLLKGRRDWRHDPLWFAPETARLHLETEAHGLEDLKGKEKPDTIWRWEFCCRIRRLHEAGECGMEAELMLPAIDDVFQELKVLDIALHPKGATKKAKSGSKRGRKNYTGNKVVMVVRERPSPRSVQRWINKLETRGWRPSSLRDGRYRSGSRARRITGDALRLLVAAGDRYATPERPTVRTLQRELKAAIDEHNLTLSEVEKIACPSEEALRRYISGLSKFRVYAGRHGMEKAKLKFAVTTSGVAATRPFERIEIDSWLVDVQSILTLKGIWDVLDENVRKKVARLHLCAAVDVCTKVMVGACPSETPTTAAALKVLRMAVTSKRAYAEAAGATLPWDQHGMFETLHADGGPQFNNAEFIGAVAMLGQSPNFPSGGVPLLRGTIESFFRTIGMQLVAKLPGKTFSNVVDRRGYEDGRACIEADELASLITRWIVDAYHGSPHDGLAGETPHDAWNRNIRLYHIQDGPDRNRLRATFGIPLKRRLGNGGILLMGLRYWCEPLRQHFLDRGDADIDVRLDPEDVSEVSVLINGTWHAASCTREGFEDVTMEAWIQASRDLAAHHRRGAART
ncbi:Mu transposase C-terminal domain-containing protein [Methylobacterium sp. J-001]|uniref:Mu transposase C-terminal domain-containing protein n=1 Tax=Methylobacterium sp. J-001 TaxID=2836609 RepID=UPI001FBB39CF|nr:Mu transposase C-terminal domain-containing protein [Methylobacterium sp. J-001]MCJ2120008.1 Mu transposase C-terminal domain-containing protein [Methylobacterium sp. J-001]